MFGLLVGAIPSERKDIGFVKMGRHRWLNDRKREELLTCRRPVLLTLLQPTLQRLSFRGGRAKAKGEEKKLPVGVLGSRGTGGSSSTGGRFECMSDPYILEANEGGSSANLNTLASGFNPFFLTWCGWEACSPLLLGKTASCAACELMNMGNHRRYLDALSSSTVSRGMPSDEDEPKPIPILDSGGESYLGQLSFLP